MSIAAILGALQLIGPAMKLLGEGYTTIRPMALNAYAALLDMWKDLLGRLNDHPAATPAQKAAAQAMLDMSVDQALAVLADLPPVPMPPLAPPPTAERRTRS